MCDMYQRLYLSIHIQLYVSINRIYKSGAYIIYNNILYLISMYMLMRLVYFSRPTTTVDHYYYCYHYYIIIVCGQHTLESLGVQAMNNLLKARRCVCIYIYIYIDRILWCGYTPIHFSYIVYIVSTYYIMPIRRVRRSHTCI